MSPLPAQHPDRAHRRRRIAFVAVATAGHLAAMAALSALPPHPGVPAGVGGHVITAEAIVEEAAAAPGPVAASPTPTLPAEAAPKEPETAEPPPPMPEQQTPPPEPDPIEAREPAPKKPAEVRPPKPEPRRPVEPRPHKPKKPTVAATRPPRVERSEAPPSAVATGSAGPAEGKAASGRGQTDAAGAPSGSVLAAYAALVAAEIERHKYYPPAAREAGLSGTVSVAFTIGPSGTVVSHAVTRSSGAPALDAVVPSMMAATRVPPPPGGRFRGTIAVRFSVGR